MWWPTTCPRNSCPGPFAPEILGKGLLWGKGLRSLGQDVLGQDVGLGLGLELVLPYRLTGQMMSCHNI